MKMLSLHTKLQGIIISFALVLFAIIGLVVYPAVRDILVLQQEINNTEEYLESQYQRSRRIAERVGNIDEVVSSTATFTNLTVSQGSELDIIKTFETLASAHRIEQKISVAYSDTIDPHTKLPYYTFTFLNHGMMSDHLDYLDAVLSQPYIVDISSIEMSRRNTTATDTTALNDVTLRFSAVIYAK